MPGDRHHGRGRHPQFPVRGSRGRAGSTWRRSNIQLRSRSRPGRLQHGARRLRAAARDRLRADQLRQSAAGQAGLRLRHVDKIDLWVGGLAEDHLPNSSMARPSRESWVDSQLPACATATVFWYQNALPADRARDLRRVILAEIIRRKHESGPSCRPMSFSSTRKRPVMIDSAGPAPQGQPEQDEDRPATNAPTGTGLRPRLAIRDRKIVSTDCADDRRF